MSQSTGGKVVGFCFMVIWVTIALSIGFSALSFGAPTIFGIVPFLMAGFGVIFCLAMMTDKLGSSGFKGRVRVQPSAQWESTGDSWSSSSDRWSSFRDESSTIYDLPDKCPECGASINMENVDWVGPLQAKCPYCMATIRANRRRL